MFVLSVALEGYAFRNSTIVERVLFAIAGVMCILPNHATDLTGIALLALLIVYQIIMKKKDATKASA